MFDCTAKFQNLIRKVVVCAVYLAFFVTSTNPHTAMAAGSNITIPTFEPATDAVVAQRPTIITNTLVVVATAYSSTPDQTDTTPYTTSNGKPVYDGLIAANWLPYNTKIRIPDYFGEKVFTVNDRMNARYKIGRMDLWMKSRSDARQFGARRVRIQIVETLN